MNKSNKNKLMITAMIVAGLLLLKCVVREHLDPSTAEWIEQPTDIVMPSINQDNLKDRVYPEYIPQVKVGEQACVDDDVAKSHLIFKDGVVPRDYVTDEQLQYPEEVLDSAELLPNDENNTWTDVNPQGTGSIAYKNFLDIGHHIGQVSVLRNADTYGSSLRAHIPNPQFNVSPWQQTTILPSPNLGQEADMCA